MSQVEAEAKYQMRQLAQLQGWDENPRTITEEDFVRLKEHITRLGLYKPLLINQSNVVLGGNMRLKALQDLGVTEVMCSVVLTDNKAQMIEYALSDNDQVGLTDKEKLAELVTLNPIKTELFAIQLGKLTPIQTIIDEVSPTPEEDEVPGVSSEPPISILGEIYQLGRHRVMCGDSTDYGATTDLLDGKTIDLVFSDPPYGIDAVKDDMVGADFGVAKKGKYSKVINDETTDSAEHFYTVVQDLCTKVILWGGNYFIKFLPFSDSWLIWDKRGDSGIKNTFADAEMAWCSFHTPIRIYTQLWNGMIREGESEKRVHPTQKPLMTLAKIIKDFSKDSELIYDGFLGSGSTLIACEQTDRTCYAMELDPKYVDVIRKRYAKLIDPDGWESNWQEVTKPL